MIERLSPRTRARHRAFIIVAATLALVFVEALSAQTAIKPPRNRYTPEQDVQLGREAAAEVRREYPVISDERIASYLDRLGRRLVQAAPPELNKPVFEYSFTPVNLKEINAFALPGGPMFVNRGMFDAAASEGEVVGVMAHELSHVLLRHGTANATKAQGFQLGALAGAITGAVIGGGWGEVISQGSQFGLGTWLLKYSREYEKQADLLGAQIMARAGYDPRDLARMFETIGRESKSGSGGPQWMNSHPDPGNRSEYIAREAAALQVASSATRETQPFQQAKATFASLPPAKSMGDLARRDTSGGGGNGANAPAAVGTLGQPVPAPAAQYRTARGGRLFEVAVPANWQALSSTSAVKFVPENAYGQVKGEGVFTHGVELGVTRAATRDLREATTALTNSLARTNPDLRRLGDQQATRISQRSAIVTGLANRSALGVEERIGLYTMFLADGNLFYYLTVVPSADADRYGPTFDRIARSIRLNDVR
jgi:beta-barrel assembly-enhancing protease